MFLQRPHGDFGLAYGCELFFITGVFPSDISFACHVAEDEFVGVLLGTPLFTTRLVFIKDITSHLISLAGKTLDIDPLFFSNHVNTHWGENMLPPSLAILPSSACTRNYVHLHYDCVVDLGTKDEYAGAAYNPKTDTNVSRNGSSAWALWAIGRSVLRGVAVQSSSPNLTELVSVSLFPLEWSVLLGYFHARGLILVDSPITTLLGGASHAG